MIAILRRLAARIRDRGVGATLAKTFGDHVYRRSTSVIVEFRHGANAIGRAEHRPDWLSFAVARTPDALPSLGSWLAPRERDFQAMLAMGKIGVFALDEGKAVACLWVSLGDHHDPVVREYYAVRDREAYHFCLLTDPHSRRRNVTLALCRYFASQFGALGVDRSFGVVDRTNRPSYLVMRHFGFRERGIAVIHAHLLRRRWTRMMPYAGVLGTTDPADRPMPRA